MGNVSLIVTPPLVHHLFPSYHSPHDRYTPVTNVQDDGEVPADDEEGDDQAGGGDDVLGDEDDEDDDFSDEEGDLVYDDEDDEEEDEEDEEGGEGVQTRKTKPTTQMLADFYDVSLVCPQHSISLRDYAMKGAETLGRLRRWRRREGCG